ncbi:hypothetical protein [Parasutterella sp.]|uniref:hypothetical protein n=1 Tax=Parasutterella sp. TaxID=2049037 RepID=UPI003521AEA6
MSVLISARQHSGGGIGSIFGSKKLKGVVIQGDQPIHIHAGQERMAEDHRTQHRSVRFSEPARRSVRTEPLV